MATKKEKVIELALQGGGAHGAYTWGVLDRLLEDGRIRIEGISGTSAGAMNGAVVADGIVCGGYDAERAREAIDSNVADLVAFGVPFLANPDLPARLENGWPLNEANPDTFYGGGAAGYTDYPAYDT